ncbi:MAG: CvpA family protein [Lachnospiraceae bacterium]
MNWLTVAVILFLLVEVLIGWKRGFVKMALSLFAVVIALVITLAAGPYVKEGLSAHTPWQTNIQESIRESFDGYLMDQMETMEPDQENALLDQLPIPEVLTNLLKENNNSAVYEKLGVDTLTSYVSSYLANMIMTAIAYVITFIFVFILLKIVFHFLHLVTRIPGLKQLNSAAGVILALVQGLILLWVLCLVLTAFANTDWGMQVMGMIKESSFLSLIYNHNLLLQLLMEIMMNL